jgi:hypothetical protein
MRTTASLFVAIAACGLGVVACADEHRISALEYDDLADHVAVTTMNPSGGEVGSMRDALELAAGTMPFGLAPAPDGHATGARGGVGYDYQLACADARGVVLPACGEPTDRATVELVWSGTLDTPALGSDLSRHGRWRLTALGSTDRRLDGDAAFAFDSDVRSTLHPNRDTTYHLQYQATYGAIRFDARRAPTAGEIHYLIDAVRTRAGAPGTSVDAFDVDAVLTFEGGAIASLVLDGARGYEIDLATGAITGCGE